MGGKGGPRHYDRVKNTRKVERWRETHRDEWNALQRAMYARRKEREAAAISALQDQIDALAIRQDAPAETIPPPVHYPRGKTHAETVALRIAHRTREPLLLDDDMRAYVGKKREKRF